MPVPPIDAGPLPTIASLSLGGSRDFLLKHKDDGKRQERFLMEVRTSATESTGCFAVLILDYTCIYSSICLVSIKYRSFLTDMPEHGQYNPTEIDKQFNLMQLHVVQHDAMPEQKTLYSYRLTN